jgi:predicted transcriptional regulator
LLVREVQEGLAAAEAQRELAHTSVITMLNIMVDKGYLRRKRSGKAYLFSPAVDEAEINRGMLGDILARVFDGSAKGVILNLLEIADLDADELKELRQLINRKAKEQD